MKYQPEPTSEVENACQWCGATSHRWGCEAWSPQGTPGNTDRNEVELDYEVDRIRELALETMYASTNAQTCQHAFEREHWLQSIREHQALIVAKIENVAMCAGFAIHGDPLSPVKREG